MATLPRYRCHKEVRAGKIGAIHHTTKGATLDLVMPEGLPQQIVPVEVTTDWVKRHEPKTGGYFVAYDGGYTSYSPAQAFESGYALLPPV